AVLDPLRLHASAGAALHPRSDHAADLAPRRRRAYRVGRRVPVRPERPPAARQRRRALDGAELRLRDARGPPRHHRPHPGSRSNFLAFFVLMDLLCGTYRRPVPPARVGLEDDPTFPKDFLTHLTMPFRG